MKAGGRALAVVALLVGCESGLRGEGDAALLERSLEVTATAYNSLPEQTHGEPDLTAWGDRLVPGMKVIAVSRDLLELGLGHGVEVEIEGLPGRYVVRDKMARRWKRKIDVYMGEDVDAAREFGSRRVLIRWRAPRPEAGPAEPAGPGEATERR